jgi:hypothetical protein
MRAVDNFLDHREAMTDISGTEKSTKCEEKSLFFVFIAFQTKGNLGAPKRIMRINE